MKKTAKSSILSIISTILAIAMLTAIISIGAFSVNAAVAGTALTTSAMGTPVVDGVSDPIWAGAQYQTLTHIVTGDSRDASATSSSTVSFSSMWDSEFLYFIFEITDDSLCVDVSETHWKNDSIFLYVSEDNVHSALDSEYSYQMAVFPGDDGIIVRNAGVNTLEKKHAYSVSGNETDGYQMTVEIAIKFNTTTLEAGRRIAFDVQYNDADAKYSVNDNNRDIVWCWSAGAAGPNQEKNNWGTLAFTQSVNAPKFTINVDGIIDNEWKYAATNTLTSVVKLDSVLPEATDTSTVNFKTRWDDDYVYMLFEITDDDFYCQDPATHWKNDSIMLFVSEDGSDVSLASDRSYQYAVFPSEEDGYGAFVRNSGINTNPVLHEAVVTGDDATGYNIVIEFAFKLNSDINEVGNNIKFDVQYNDVNPDRAAEGNPRDIVWSWSAGSDGPNQMKTQWGTLNFVELSPTELATATAFDVYYQTRINQNNTDKHDVRIVINANLTELYKYNELTIKVEFTLTDMTKVSYTGTLSDDGGDYTVFKTIIAGNDLYEAPANNAIFGNVITGIPDGAYTSINVTVTDTATSSVLANVSDN